MIRAMRHRIAPMFVIALAVLAAACSSSSSTSASAPAPSAPPGGAVIVAQDLKFDRTTLSVPAGTAASLLFQNRDGAPHNVSITGPDGEKLFAGATFTGPLSMTYQLPPLAAGTYPFQCDVHTDMKGTLTAS
jgi:plastocyanin